jgi:glycosyltransferase involved in cell wall biosynthesis
MNRRRVLHVVARSLPHVNGYTVRTRGIVDAQRAAGWEPAVISSPYYPGAAASLADEAFGGTPHLRVRHPLDESGSEGTAWPGRLTAADRLAGLLHRGRASLARRRVRLLGPLASACAGAEELLLMRRFERAIVAAGRQHEAAIVHVHSPYRCALPAIAAARRLGIAVVYEVRGLWEETAVAEGTLRRGSVAYKLCRQRERNAMRGADAVVVISEALRDAVAERGVPRERIVVSPNGVDPEALRPRGGGEPPEVALLRRGLRGGVLGYVGSLRRLEGVDELVRAAAELARRGEDVSVLVVGGGTELEPLGVLAASLGLSSRACFTGEVAHEQVAWYYGLIDVLAITRPANAVTELVPPLKPLEAMALGRAVIVSGLPPLRELVRDGETGLVYAPGSVPDLADKAQALLRDGELRARLASAARAWVERERTWAATLAPVHELYARLVGAAGSASANRE